MMLPLCESLLNLIDIHARLGIEIFLFLRSHIRRILHLMRSSQSILDVLDQTSDAVRFGRRGGSHGLMVGRATRTRTSTRTARVTTFEVGEERGQGWRVDIDSATRRSSVGV